MALPRISLQALEAFERVSASGSMQQAALELGLSISTVSHHIARLEEQLGAVLLDRATRPFHLTREGEEALHHLRKGLPHLRRATSETAIGGLVGTRSLHVGIVEDFESRVAPELAVALASQMPRARLAIHNVLSHEAPSLLRKGQLDIVIASEADQRIADIQSNPLVRDPFVIAAPKSVEVQSETLLSGTAALPFLRFNPNHLIGAQIETHLARSRISLPDRYAFDSAQSIMAIIANGDGWAVMTPLGFIRARRFIDRVQLLPLPVAAFARQISLMSRSDFDLRIARAVSALIRQIIAREAVAPVVAFYPWLSSAFSVLERDD
ncbi:LysR family transcriptional regulator [uncultured Roseobacter sp.]|uniref:LysR family transcriptional regulator n=1 Tax=uncultured Roseobacter sp. TaxID=114847 RepID=UPI0026310B78|nr:LysR family transcriptional regulator [uncultured Roseobacter sp.]